MLLFFWNLVMRLFRYLAANSCDLHHCLTGLIKGQTKSQKTGVLVLLANKLWPFHWVKIFLGLFYSLYRGRVLADLKVGLK